MQRYEQFISVITNNLERLSYFYDKREIDTKSFSKTLPPQILQSVWKPILNLKGFYLSLSEVSHSLLVHLQNKLMIRNTKIVNQIHEYQLSLLVHKVVLYKVEDAKIQQIVNRIKEAKRLWNLKPETCIALLASFQIGQQKENISETQRYKILSEIMTIFNLTELKINYQYYGIQLLSISINESLYCLINLPMQLSHLYKCILFKNKSKVIYLLSKLKNKQLQFGSILSHFLLPENNETDTDRIKNILVLFLFTQCWDHFKEENSKLKNDTVKEIIGQAFHRMFYHLYDHKQILSDIFLNFLLHSTFTFHQEIIKALSYHLLALHKLKKQEQKQQTVRLIEKIWKQKMGNSKINEMYIDKESTFITLSQKTEELPLEEYQSITMKKSIQSKQIQVKSYTNSCKSQRMSTKITGLQNWIKFIYADLKKFNIEKVYLMMGGFKQYCIQQYEQYRPEQQPRGLMIKVVINLIKKMQNKIQYRLGGSALCKAAYMEMLQLMDRRYLRDHQFRQMSKKKVLNNNQNVQSLGLFQLCIPSNQTINVESLIKFHEQNSFEQSLQTVMNLKMLNNELNCNVSSQKMDKFHEYFQSDSFQAKVYELYQLSAKQKKLQNKKLSIIAKLIGLKSNNILNNLLVNYLYDIFRSKNIGLAQKKLDAYSILLNNQIKNSVNKQRVCLLLQMANVFEKFDQKIKSSTLDLIEQSPTANYFNFLRRQGNSPFFMAYSNAYYQHNYLKQSLYFLQMSVYSNPESAKDPSIIKRAIVLYQRLYLSFNNSVPFIKKHLQIACQQQIPQKPSKLGIQIQLLQILRLTGQLSRLINFYQGVKISQQNRLTFWLSIYYPILLLFIEEISSLCQTNQIRSSILKCNIMYKILNVNMEMIESSASVNSTHAPAIVQRIQQLQLYDDQIIIYQFLLRNFKIHLTLGYVQNLYLDKLLKNKCHAQLLLYLRKDLYKWDPNTKMTTPHLCYLIKLYYSTQQYSNALSMLNILHERGEQIQNIIQMYHIQLQSRYLSMFSHTLEDSLFFIKEKCLAQPIKNYNNMKKYLGFYFKIFRMIFNRYTFVTTNQNNLFMKIFFEFIDNHQILTVNQQFLSDSIFYLIRFVIQKFYYCPEVKEYGKILMSKFQNFTLHFVPFINYLLKRISGGNEKAQVIETILVVVLSKHPDKCVWIIAFINNFGIAKCKENMHQDEEREMIRLSSISKKLRILLESKKMLNTSHLNWIDNLIVCSLQEASVKAKKIQQNKLSEIPSNLIFVFEPEYYIKKLLSFKVLGNGKSSPLQITFQLIRIEDNHIKSVKVIIKGNIGCKHYRMESNTANFFQEIGFIDSDITYRIFHLSKYLVIIEHVDHRGTLKSVMTSYSDIEKIQSEFMKKISERKKISADKRLLELYDANKNCIKAPISRIIYGNCKNIRDWWIKISNFVKTHAQWSYLGYIVGLGDRHTDNILLTEQAKLIHIDFQYALDTGLKLRYPEWVPFRLTHCLVQPLGILGVYGLFYAEMISIATQFQENQANVWRVLSHFAGSSSTNITQQILNRSKFGNLKIQCCQDGIAKIINNARDPQLLRLMFDGWGAYF